MSLASLKDIREISPTFNGETQHYGGTVPTWSSLHSSPQGWVHHWRPQQNGPRWNRAIGFDVNVEPVEIDLSICKSERWWIVSWSSKTQCHISLIVKHDQLRCDLGYFLCLDLACWKGDQIGGATPMSGPTASLRGSVPEKGCQKGLQVASFHFASEIRRGSRGKHNANQFVQDSVVRLCTSWAETVTNRWRLSNMVHTMHLEMPLLYIYICIYTHYTLYSYRIHKMWQKRFMDFDLPNPSPQILDFPPRISLVPQTHLDHMLSSLPSTKLRLKWAAVSAMAEDTLSRSWRQLLLQAFVLTKCHQWTSQSCNMKTIKL